MLDLRYAQEQDKGNVTTHPMHIGSKEYTKKRATYWLLFKLEAVLDHSGDCCLRITSYWSAQDEMALLAAFFFSSAAIFSASVFLDFVGMGGGVASTAQT